MAMLVQDAPIQAHWTVKAEATPQSTHRVEDVDLVAGGVMWKLVLCCTMELDTRQSQLSKFVVKARSDDGALTT